MREYQIHMATGKTTKKSTKKATASKITTTKTQVSAAVENTHSPKSKTSFKRFATKRNIIIVLLLVLLGAGIYFFRSYLIAATVNGQPISRLEVIQELEKQSGKQVLESMVTKNLILQEMEKKNITVTQDEVSAEIKKIEEALSSQGRTLNDALEMQGLNRAELEEQLKIQKMIEKLFAKDAVVSDAEVQAYLEENKDALPADQDEETLKTTIKEQLKQQKLSEKFQKWLEELQKQAKIDYYVNY